MCGLGPIDLFVRDGVAADTLAPWAQLSALTVLGGVCWRLFSTLDRLCDRWDAWEKIRHADSVTLNQTLTDLQSNCAAMQTIRDLKQIPGKN